MKSGAVFARQIISTGQTRPIVNEALASKHPGFVTIEVSPAWKDGECLVQLLCKTVDTKYVKDFWELKIEERDGQTVRLLRDHIKFDPRHGLNKAVKTFPNKTLVCTLTLPGSSYALLRGYFPRVTFRAMAAQGGGGWDEVIE